MRTAFTVAIAAGLAATATAQDSVSSTGNGDALDAYDASTVVTDYVVETTPFLTSWGTTFGIAPIVKSNSLGNEFNNNLISAQGISKDLLRNVDLVTEAYSLWNTPGAGVNPTNNTAGTIIDPTDTPRPFNFNQQAVIFADFGFTTSGANFNGVTGALVNYDPADPSRLFVRRVNAAINGANPNQDASQFGVGSIDADGNGYFRADDFNTTGPNSISGNNLLRTRLGDRSNGVQSVVTAGFGATDATDVLRANDGGVLVAPNNVPASVAGGNGIVSTVDFNAQYVRGAAAATRQFGALLAPGANDTRGALGSTTATPLGGSYTIVQSQKAVTGIGDTDSFALHALDSSGNIITPSSILLTIPANVSDPVTGFTVPTVGGEFRQYGSQTAFRGGTGQIAVHEDRNGDLIVAGVYSGIAGLDSDPTGTLVTARVPAGGGATQWSVVANSTDAGINSLSGKEILDGPGGSPIGRCVQLFEVTGGTPLGPSMSAPAFDAAGNLWFISAVALDKVDADGMPFVDTDSALLRAVYNPDTFGYELELVVELGQVFDGQNSGTPYQIQFLGIADSNSISSGTFFSSNVSSRAFDDLDVTTLDQADPRTNGGAIINADIVYDTNGDGMFDEDLGDEGYQSILYIGFTDEEVDTGNPGCNPADIAEPFGVLDLGDIDAFILAFNTGDSLADIAAPFGVLDLGDIDLFILEFFAGCP